MHPTWPLPEEEGLCVLFLGSPGRPLHMCNWSVFVCMSIVKIVIGEKSVLIKVGLELLGTEDRVYFCSTWLCRKEFISTQSQVLLERE